MRKNILLLTLVVLQSCFAAYAQSIERKVIASAGVYFEGSSFTISSTLGETFGATLVSNNLTLTQGFQQPPCQVFFKLISSSVLCHGGHDGTATVYALSGTRPFTYSWSPSGGSGMEATQLAAGTYTVTVTDALGCSSIDSILVPEPDSLLVSASSSGSSPCSGNTGAVLVSASGGTPEYNGTGMFIQTGTSVYTVTDMNGCSATTTITTYNESVKLTSYASPGSIACDGGLTSVMISAIGGFPPYTGTGVFSAGAGTFTYTVFDASGCSSETSITLTQPDPLSIFVVSTDIICHGDSSLVTLSAYGGVGNYSGTGTFIQHAGDMTYTVIDANGCSATTTVTLTQPEQLNATAGSGFIFCNGGITSLTVYATGGTGAYFGVGSYTIGAGTHTYTVSDAVGCISSTSITVTSPPAINISVFSGIINCFGGSANVDISATGGTPPLSGEGSFVQYAGSQNYVVIDAEGCISSTSVTLSEPSKVEIYLVSATNSGCSNNSGTATATALGGTPSYNYLWSSGQSGATASGLSAGFYNVTVTDSRGCTASTSITITQAASNPPVPSVIIGALSVCRNTTQVYSVQNIPGVTYNWTLPPGATGISSGNSISVSFNSLFIGGQLCVSSVNSCGVSASSCIGLTCIAVAPPRPNIFSGPSVVCGPTFATYSVSPVPGATSYTWVVNGGLSIVSGNGTNSVVLNIPANFTQGTMFVFASNCFGNSTTSSYTINGLTGLGSILGPTMGLCAGTSATYIVNSVANAGGFVWSATGNVTLVPAGNQCTAYFGSNWTSGTLSVSISSPCGTFTRTITLRSVPVQPGSIIGQGTNVCNSTRMYYISPVAGATSYTWTAPAGVIIVGNGTSATVTFPAGFTSNSIPICVTANNSCGSSPARCFTVTTRPPTPVVSGPSTVCKNGGNYTYTATVSVSGISYYWTATGGAILAPSGSTAQVNFSPVVPGGQSVFCAAFNSCGYSQKGVANVTVNNCRMSDDKKDVFEHDMTVYPNPARDHVTVSFHSAEEDECILTLTDVLGRVLLVKSVNAVSGETKVVLETSPLKRGVYAVHLMKGAHPVNTRLLVLE